MSISRRETRSLSRHFLAICRSKEINEDQIIAMLPIKSFQSIEYWTSGATCMQQPSVNAIRWHLKQWGADVQSHVDSYMELADDMTVPQKWELVRRLMDDLE